MSRVTGSFRVLEIGWPSAKPSVVSLQNLCPSHPSHVLLPGARLATVKHGRLRQILVPMYSVNDCNQNCGSKNGSITLLATRSDLCLKSLES